MIFYTGDIHGSASKIISLCKERELSSEDTIIILGDVGANYYRNKRDEKVKQAFSKLAPTILCIHGNHEIRPANIPSYKMKTWNGGQVRKYFESDDN